MKTQPQVLGAAGEHAAALFLQAAGQQILDRNWRCPTGELDLVIRTNTGQVAFVEVKTRSSLAFGTGFEAISRTKYRRLSTLGILWARAHHEYLPRLRIDVIEVYPGPAGELSCTWHESVSA